MIVACGTPKPRKAPETGPLVWMARAGRPIVRRHIGAGGMHRHAVGDRRAPARIGAGVEIALEDHAGDAAVVHPRRCVAVIDRRVALGGRHHGFGARVGERRRAAGLAARPARSAAAATGRAWSRSRRRWPSGRCARAPSGRPSTRRRILAVHVGRLGAGGDDQRVAVHAGEARLRLDIGMLDIGGLDAAGHGDGGARQRRLGVAALDEAARQYVAGACRVDAARRPARWPRPASAACGSSVQVIGKVGEVEIADRRRARRRRAPPPRRGSARRSSASAGWSAKGAMTPKRLSAGNVGGGEDTRRCPDGWRRSRRDRRRRSARGGAASG